MKYILVTVGTTEFVDLVRAFESESILQLLKEQNYDKMFVQFGSGNPPNLTSSLIATESFNYKYGTPWKTLYKNADLIVSHAGAGSCLEALENSRRLLVVINETLMDNHQIELAAALKQSGYLEYCLPKSLDDGLKSIASMSIVPFPRGNPAPINHELRKLFCL